MPEAGPLGETFFEASALATADALVLKRPSSGWVESVSTFADHFFFVAIGASKNRFLCVHRMRVEALLSAAFKEKVAEHAAAFFGEEAGGDFDAVVELRVVHDGEDAAAGSGFGVVGGVDEAGDAGVENGARAHGAGFKRDVEGAAPFGGDEAVVREGAACFAKGDDLGVGGGVAVAEDSVLASAYDVDAVGS